MTGLDFLVYCQNNKDSIVFLIHVPELETYQGEVRDFLLQLAWFVASEFVAELASTDEVEIAIGIRGQFLYGGSAIGMFGDEPICTNESKIARSTFHKYFAASNGEVE